jgi:hypothetical protein
MFSVALSVESALSESPRPLAGMLPCGDRTFLPQAGDHPSGKPRNNCLMNVEIQRNKSRLCSGLVYSSL